MLCVVAAGVFVLDLIALAGFSPYLSVVGQVVRTVHELLQGAPRPVGALVAGGQLLRRRGSSIAHVQGGFPRGSALHVPPLAEVSRYWVPQQSDVVKFPVGSKKEQGERGKEVEGKKEEGIGRNRGDKKIDFSTLWHRKLSLI